MAIRWGYKRRPFSFYAERAKGKGLDVSFQVFQHAHEICGEIRLVRSWGLMFSLGRVFALDVSVGKNNNVLIRVGNRIFSLNSDSWKDK